MADYNRWANMRVYSDVGRLSKEQQHREVGIYFGSIVATLRHLLNTDRAWAFILQGGRLEGMPSAPLSTDFGCLRGEREEEDKAMISWLEDIDETWLNQSFSFTSALGDFSGRTYKGTHASCLAHVFNHQTHHRGQIHAALTSLGFAEPLALDLLVKGFHD
jgi:uncharacterized damage-inducible protein DinB